MIFEKKGLVSRDQIDSAVLDRWSIRQIEAFSEELYEAVESADSELRKTAAEDDPFATFNFVASLSLSGAAGCFEMNCRVRRAQLLARYAALYADRVIAPIQLMDPHRRPRPSNPNEERHLRYDLAGTLLTIHEMRSVIEAGMVASAFGFFLIAAASSLAFWAIEAVTKRHQIRNYPRIREIEVNRYKKASADERLYSVPRMNWSWTQAKLVFAGRGALGAEVVEIPSGRNRGYMYSFMFPHVALPHAIMFAIAVALFLLGCTRHLPGFALGAVPTK